MMAINQHVHVIEADLQLLLGRDFKRNVNLQTSLRDGVGMFESEGRIKTIQLVETERGWELGLEKIWLVLAEMTEEQINQEKVKNQEKIGSTLHWAA